MAKLNVTDRDGVLHVIEGEVGRSVMVNMRDNDLPVLAACGGFCACATCHVHVDADWRDRVGTQTQDELDLVSESQYFQAGASRLSCQIMFDDTLDGLKVTLAPED